MKLYGHEVDHPDTKYIEAAEFIEYRRYETECPHCTGTIDTLDTPSNGNEVQCLDCGAWFTVTGEWEM